MDPIITQAPDFLIDDVFVGDTVVLTVTCTRNGVAENLTGATVLFTAKANLTDLDASAILSYATGSGITVATPSTGIATVTCAATDTANAPADTTIFASVRVITAAGERFTAAFGQMIFRSPVTTRVS